MQPWKISAGRDSPPRSRGLPCCSPGPHLEFLAPFWTVILSDYGVLIALHLGLALTAALAAIYAVARAAGLADLGSRVDLVERSVRRGEGDPGLADALKRDADGEWE